MLSISFLKNWNCLDLVVKDERWAYYSEKSNLYETQGGWHLLSVSMWGSVWGYFFLTTKMMSFKDDTSLPRERENQAFMLRIIEEQLEMMNMRFDEQFE